MQFSLLDPFAPRQLQHQRLIEGRLRGEVERVEALDLRKPCEAYATLDVAPFAIDPLQLAQLAREGGKLQRLEMIAQQHLRRDDRR
jgi:hypothetical protein